MTMKVLKVIGIIVGVVILGVVAMGTYIKVALPKADAAPELTIEQTSARIERGKYLAYHVAACMDCHSTRMWDRFAAPMAKSGVGGGGEIFSREMGFPGEFYARNITPYAIGDWTDGELFRAITSGVSRDGSALFPLMASHRFGKMDRQDLYDIIAFVRTLDPVRKDVPRSKPDFPVNILINTMPQKPDFQQRPSESDTLKYGAYLVNAAGCVDCHSQTDKGTIIAGTEFGGGMEFKQPAGILRSSNITAHPVNGIGKWTKATFVARFKQFSDSVYHAPTVAKNSYNTPMPWTMYAGMKTKDLEAIYAYLFSLKPLDHPVSRFSAVK
jgi:hypothetical protein